MVGLENANEFPNFVSLPSTETAPTELEQIEVLDGMPRQTGNTLVRVGTAVTNERLRHWCVKNNKNTLPMTTIVGEITLGGSNSSFSDLVREVEYIDAHGKVKTVSNPDHLRAASGCFGLMGVVTRITLEFSPRTYTLSSPAKLPLMKAVPPPAELDDKDIPTALFIPRTAEEKVQDQITFERKANSDYYSEWSWFPFSDCAWVHCWNDTIDSDVVADDSNTAQVFLSWATSFTLNVIQRSPLMEKLASAVHLNEAATTLTSLTCMYTVADAPIKTSVPTSFSSQFGIQNVPSHNMELSIPLLAKAHNPSAIDYTTAQRAWWDAILVCYRNSSTCPQRLPLSMRIAGTSNTLMSPRHQTTTTNLGTCTLEISTPTSISKKIWRPYAQAVLNKWTSYIYPRTGKRLATRPSWSKDWKELRVGGQPWAEKLKSESYKAEIAEFVRVLAEMGGEAGWTLADVKKRFSNGFFDWFVFEDVVVPQPTEAPAAVSPEVVEKLDELERVVMENTATESLVVENKALEVGQVAAVTTVEVTEIL